MIEVIVNITSGPLSSILNFSLYKKRALSPLTEPIEVAIPAPDADLCIVVQGVYPTATKKYIPCAEPEGVTPQQQKNTVAMPLFGVPRT
jgi:hypothetical protein